MYWPVYQPDLLDVCLNAIRYWGFDARFGVVLLTKLGEDALTQCVSVSEANIKFIFAAVVGWWSECQTAEWSLGYF